MQIQKRFSSPLANGKSSSINLFGNNERDKKPTHHSGSKGNMGILFSQLDHSYCRIPAGDFKNQDGQGFQGNEKFVKRMDIKKPIYQKLIQALGPVDVDLFASRSYLQIRKFISWQPDPHAWVVDAFQINWIHLKACTFTPFALIGRVLAKVIRNKRTLIIITSV